jgi:5-amino-6-(5-phosphoribosylamino)uracil reductase
VLAAMTESRTSGPLGRPFVTLNVAESVDGKLAPIDRGKVNFGSAEDRAQMDALRTLADGVLIGAGTLRAEDPPLLIRDPVARDRRTAAGRSPHPLNITVCTVLPENLGEMLFFRSPDAERLVFTTELTPPEVREAAKQFARIEVVPVDATRRVDLAEVLRVLPSLGVSHLLLEGGGELNFSMLEAGLIDEIYLTVCPFIFGGRAAPTSFDGAGFTREHVRKLALKSHRLSADAPALEPSRLFPNGFLIS